MDDARDADDDADDDGCAGIDDDVDEERKERGRATPGEPSGVGNRKRERETGRDDETCDAGERDVGGWVFGECISQSGDG